MQLLASSCYLVFLFIYFYWFTQIFKYFNLLGLFIFICHGTKCKHSDLLYLIFDFFFLLAFAKFIKCIVHSFLIFKIHYFCLFLTPYMTRNLLIYATLSKQIYFPTHSNCFCGGNKPQRGGDRVSFESLHL